MEHPDCLRLRFGQIDLLYSKQEMLLLDTHVFLYYFILQMMEDCSLLSFTILPIHGKHLKG